MEALSETNLHIKPAEIDWTAKLIRYYIDKVFLDNDYVVVEFRTSDAAIITSAKYALSLEFPDTVSIGFFWYFLNDAADAKRIRLRVPPKIVIKRGDQAKIRHLGKRGYYKYPFIVQ